MLSATEPLRVHLPTDDSTTAISTTPSLVEHPQGLQPHPHQLEPSISTSAFRLSLRKVVPSGSSRKFRPSSRSCGCLPPPGDELHVKIKRNGVRQGNMVAKAGTYDDRDMKRPGIPPRSPSHLPPTTYVLTGEDSQEFGTGANLFNDPPAAHAVEMQLMPIFSLSAASPSSRLSRTTLKEKATHSGGIKGQAICTRYMDMIYDTMDMVDVVCMPSFCRHKCSYSTIHLQSF